jgi:Zn-dependent protease with chaperone function
MFFIAPFLVALGCLAGATAFRRSTPRAMALLLTAGIVLMAVSTVASLALLAADFLADRVGWCRDTWSGHLSIPWPVGLLSLIALGTGLRRAVTVALRHRAVRMGPMPASDLVIDRSATPFAFAVPGPRPHIVISQGLLHALAPAERAAVVAHERAHLAARHDIVMATAEVAAACLPLLRRATRSVRYATERSADEAAALAVGDRQTVAYAIARAALAGHDRYDGLLSFRGSDVTDRVSALLEPPPLWRAELCSAAVGALIVAAAVAAAAQIHHAVGLVRHLCLI